MIVGTVTGDRETLASLHGFRASLASRVGRIVGAFGLEVLAGAKRLAPIKTGRLRRSIHLELVTDNAGTSGTVGTNVEYAAMFEHGFKGTESVRGFMRKQTMAWGRPIDPQMVSVRPFIRRVDRAARPFLAPALAGVTPTLADRLRGLTAAPA